MTDIRHVQAIAPNFKRRLSGVTSTIIQLIPRMQALGYDIQAMGSGLPSSLPHLSMWNIPLLYRRPQHASFRVFHARRNTEMLMGIILRDLFRMPLKVVFTSASQRKHTRYTKWLIQQMDHLISTSQKTAAYLDHPSTVILHGIDLQRFCPATDKRALKKKLGLDPDMLYVGCFGRIRAQKGTDLFVDASMELLKSRGDWQALVLGRATGPYIPFEQSLIKKVKSAKLEDRIHFKGEHKNIEDWYKVLDLFIAPQRWEGFGLTPLEAMACGVPVVATDVGAFSELIQVDSTGTIVPTSVQGLIDGAALYMDDKDRRLMAGQKALVHVQQNFDLDLEAKSLIKIYKNLSQ